MKKLLALLIAVTLILSLAACGSTGSGGKDNPANTEPTDPPTIADETSIANISFKTPDKYKTVGRYITKSADGKITEKDISFYFDDDSSLTYACNIGIKLSDVISLDSLKKEKYNGMNFYTYESKPDKAALIQRGKDVYGFRYTFADDIDKKAFKAKMSEISFTDDTSMGSVNDDDLYAINYTLDKSWKVSKTESNQYETPEGEITKKDISWSIGKDKDKPDFRFMIRVTKNTKVKDELPDGYTTKKTKLGGVSYTAVYDTESSKKPYAYYTQQGKDVYQIRNKGVSSGWFVDRSEESYEAFDILMKSVSFK